MVALILAVLSLASIVTEHMAVFPEKESFGVQSAPPSHRADAESPRESTSAASRVIDKILLLIINTSFPKLSSVCGGDWYQETSFLPEK